jgi:transcriptional regulator with XRE-family HTH domain
MSNPALPPSLLLQSFRIAVSRSIVQGRLARGWSRRELARRAKLSRHVIDRIENGAISPSLETVARLFSTLRIDAELVTRVPLAIGGERQRDPGHARCGAYVQRRLQSAGLLVEREVEIVGDRTSGWIDLLAFEPTTRTLLIIEIKTQLDDLGRTERTLGWYARLASSAARRFRWRPRRAISWLLLLATEAVDDRLRANRQALREAFPGRAPAMQRWTREPAGTPAATRGLALVDPGCRRRAWLLRAAIDGRRTPAPYRNYADFVGRVSRSGVAPRTPPAMAPPPRHA